MIRNSMFLTKVLGISPKLVIHVGADKGQDRTEYISVGAKKIIWCEADPVNVTYLRSKYPEDSVWSGIIWSRDNEVIQFHIMPNRAESSAILPINVDEISPAEVISLNTLTLDRIMADEVIPHQSLLTIDVQGAELEVLNGALSTLSRVGYAVIEIALTSQGYEITPTEEEIFSILKPLGFRRSIARYSHDEAYKDQLFVRTNLIRNYFIIFLDFVFDKFMKFRHLLLHHHLPKRHYSCRKCDA
jgi:FkbM family methyltransferase